MKQDDYQQSLEDVLDDYMASTEHPSREGLIEWIRRYPHYAKELAEFTTSWLVLETADVSTEDADIDEEALIARGMEVVHGLLNKNPPTDQEAEEKPITNLVEEAGAQGLTRVGFATALGLGSQVLSKLNRGMIRATSIPAELINRIAEVIHRRPSTVAAFLLRGPRLATGAEYRATRRPTVADQQDFFEAVRDDTTIGDGDKAFWLDIEANTERK